MHGNHKLLHVLTNKKKITRKFDILLLNYFLTTTTNKGKDIWNIRQHSIHDIHP